MSREHPVPDWELAMYRLGELQPARADKIRARLEADPELAARLAALDAREAELMERVPPRVLSTRVEDVAAPEERKRRVRRWWIAAELMAAVLLLVLILPPMLTPEQVQDFTPQGIRDKGVEPYLRIFRQVPGGLEELDPQDPVGPGERLQISYVALGRPHGAVFSVDGRGTLTQHLPLTGEHSAELQPKGTVDLAESYVLDDAPAFERFFLVTSAEPFDLGPVFSAAGGLGLEASPELPRGLAWSDFSITKDDALR